MADSDLLAANKRLAELRAQARAHKKHPSFLSERQKTVVSPTPTPPAQLTFDDALLSKFKRLITTSRGDGRDHSPRTERETTVSSCSRPVTPQLRVTTVDNRVKTVKAYPSLGFGAFEAEATAVYRVWLLLRHLDTNGRGWVAVAAARAALTADESALRLFSWRRLRQIMGEGNGRFWVRSQRGDVDRLYLCGAHRVAAELGVARLAGRPVALPVAAVVAGIAEFRAHLYGAFHSGRKAAPISRESQQRLTAVPERTQRHYCQLAKIERTTNLALGRRAIKGKMSHETAFERGQGCFVFVDYNGRQGRKNGRYECWQLPTSHAAIHDNLPKGRQKKINATLKDLVEMRGRGTAAGVDRIFHTNGKEASKAQRKRPQNDHYWRQQTQQCTSIWGVLD